MRLWKFTPGANCAEPVTKAAARRIAWDGGDGTIIVNATTESEAYQRATAWIALDAHDDVGDLGLDWTQAEPSAVLISY